MNPNWRQSNTDISGTRLLRILNKSVFLPVPAQCSTQGYTSMTNPTIVGRARSRSKRRHFHRPSSKMENPVWENRRLGGDLKSNYSNNLTMNNFKRQPPPSSPVQFLDVPEHYNTTYHKSDLIEKGVKQLSKDLGEFVKPYKPKSVEPNQRLVFLTWKTPRQNGR